MRELKFRAWDRLTSKMSPSFSLFGEFTLIGGVHAWQHECAVKLSLDLISEKFDSLGRLNDLEVMQYIGRKDINGIDVYEGDIVRLIEPNRLYTVEWAEFGFKLIHADPNLNKLQWGGINRVTEFKWNIEVIGNIYEHKHLLK